MNEIGWVHNAGAGFWWSNGGEGQAIDSLGVNPVSQETNKMLHLPVLVILKWKEGTYVNNFGCSMNECVKGRLHKVFSWFFAGNNRASQTWSQIWVLPFIQHGDASLISCVDEEYTLQTQVYSSHFGNVMAEPCLCPTWQLICTWLSGDDCPSERYWPSYRRICGSMWWKEVSLPGWAMPSGFSVTVTGNSKANLIKAVQLSHLYLQRDLEVQAYPCQGITFLQLEFYSDWFYLTPELGEWVPPLPQTHTYSWS